MIGCWHHPVVRLSVCDAVHCGYQGQRTGLTVVPACSYQASFLFDPADTFAVVGMYIFATKRVGKKTSGRKREGGVLGDGQSGVLWSRYPLIFTEFVNRELLITEL